MKKTTLLIACIAVSGIFASCSKEDTLDTLSRSSNNKSVSEDVHEEIRGYMADALIIFNESIRPYYEESQNYEHFCELLNVSQDEITTTGKRLLQLGYECLKNNYSDDFIREKYTGKYMTEAIDLILVTGELTGRQLKSLRAIH